MKNYVLLILFAIITSSAIGQKVTYATDTLKVYGNCDMCKERIENACDVVGIKRASWDEKTQMLKVVYRPDKISIEEVHQLCANAGHATSKLKADEEAYEHLHHCCKYVVHDHEGGDHDH